MRQPSSNPVLAELFRHNLWAIRTLFDPCATLSEDVLATNVPGTYGTVRDTLGHLLGTEEGYLAGLVGEPQHDAAAEHEATPNLATLRERALQAGEVFSLATMGEHAVKSGGGLIAYAETVYGNPNVRVTWFDQTCELPVALFMVQAINHATEHRAQIKTTLTQAGVNAPELDGWAWDREKSRPVGSGR